MVEEQKVLCDTGRGMSGEWRKLANPRGLLTQREGQAAKDRGKTLQDSVMEQ